MTHGTWHEFVERCKVADRIVLVAPYIKLDALSMALDKIGNDASVECFSRWTALDIQVGASDIVCRTLVKRRGGSFRLHNRLHAKYYRADDYVLVGSANLTQSGLGQSNSPNLEILTQASASFGWVGFEKTLLRESREVTDQEFELWEQCPVTETRLPTDGFPEMDIGDWKPHTRQPDYLWRVYSGKSLPSDDQYEPATADLAALLVPSNLNRETFEGWVRTAVSASAFVRSVLERIDTQDGPVLWDAVCVEWNVSDRATAARLVETVQSWVRRYNPSALTSDDQ